MKKITFLLVLLTLAFTTVNAQTETIFGWETASNNGDNTTETIDGIELTFTDPAAVSIVNASEFGGTTGNVALGSNTDSSVTFTFNQAVVINSIYAIEGAAGTIDYTFTPTGGNNAPVVVSLVGGTVPGDVAVNLNWVNVTSFTVSAATNTLFGFDNLSVYAFNENASVFGWETAANNGDNTTETIDGIELTFTDPAAVSIVNAGGFGGTTDNVALGSNTDSSVTFTFNQAVVISSIYAIEGAAGTIDYTFTPTGGNNAPVVVSLVGGTVPGNVAVALNWVNVTSFTVSAPTNALFGFDNLSVHSFSSSTVFEWETAVDLGTSVTETMDGITVTVVDSSSDPNSPNIADNGSFFGTSGKFVKTASTTNSVTFTFDKTVDVYSILPIDTRGRDDRELTFTPTPLGTNTPVVTTLFGGVVPGGGTLQLNWTEVTGFTVEVTASPLTLLLDFGFDNLSVTESLALSVADVYNPIEVKVFPNPVENTVYIKNVTDLKSIDVYNSLGQRVMQSKKDTIDVSHLSKGLYFLKIHSSTGTQTKRIIKR